MREKERDQQTDGPMVDLHICSPWPDGEQGTSSPDPPDEDDKYLKAASFALGESARAYSADVGIFMGIGFGSDRLPAAI